MKTGILKWTDQADITAPISNATADLSVDGDWLFFLPSTYHGFEIYPVGVVVDNSANSSAITFKSGSLNVAVPAFVAAPITLPLKAQTVEIIGAGVAVPLVFFIKPDTPTIINYEAASALAANQAIPAGLGGTFFGAVVPVGWLLRDGSSKSRATFAALFAAIGTTWGNGLGDGLTFSLPDTRSQVAIDASPGNGTTLSARVLGTHGGLEKIGIPQLPAHNHPVTGTPVITGQGDIITNNGDISGGGGFPFPQTGTFTGGVSVIENITVGPGSLGTANVGGALEHLPPWYGVTGIIKA